MKSFIGAVDIIEAVDNISFSIITPFHNRMAVLLRAVDSILEQSYQSYELILIDDASTDRSLHALSERYGDKIATGSIKLLHCPQHKGAAQARNLALSVAKNPWICYLDSDNCLYPNALELFVHAIMLHPSHQLFHACWDLASSGKRYPCIPFNRKKILKGNFIDLGVFVHAREVYEKLGGFDPKLKRLMDWDLIIRYTQDQAPIFIPHSLMLYNDSKEDTSRITIKESLKKARVRIREKTKKRRQKQLHKSVL